MGPSGPAAPTPSFWYVRLSTLVNELRQERQHAVESLAVLPVANPSELKGAREGACLFLGEASQPYGCGAWAAALADHAHFSTVVFADLVSARPPASAGAAPGISSCVAELAAQPELDMPLNITLARIEAIDDPFLLTVLAKPDPAQAAASSPAPQGSAPSPAATAAVAPAAPQR